MNSIAGLPDAIEQMGDGFSITGQGFQELQNLLVEDGSDDLLPLAQQVGRMKALAVYLQQQTTAASAIAQQIVDARTA